MFLLNHKVFGIILALFLSFSEGQKEQYCRKNLCPGGGTHIGCENNGSFGPKCPSDAAVIEIDQSAKQSLLNTHNLLRQEWASGKGRVKREACKMATMAWDQDLAYLAELNVRGCALQHDQCHNTEKFPQSGQNIFMMGNTSPQQSSTYVLGEAMSGWSKEADLIRAATDVEKLTFNVLQKIGHLTVMINEQSTHVGCALVTFTKNRFRYYHVACNYAATNIVDSPVYTKCAKPGSGCPKEKLSSSYAPLCA